MKFKQTLDYLYKQLPIFQREGEKAYKANLDNINSLDSYFCSPHKNYPIIHIAGTNGKGSTSHMLASILQSAGYRVGLYTSPHLVDFRERIRVNGELISEDYVIDFVDRYKEYFESLSPSFFELTVAMAFLYFKDVAVDVAIIETGLGGRLDSTNIVTPICSVITNIGLDHQSILGDSIELIALEKAGIIKPKIPVIIGKTRKSALKVLERVAEERESIITHSNEVQLGKFENNYLWLTNDRKELSIELSLHGDYQFENLRTVLATLPTIKTHFEINDEQLISGLSEVQDKTGLAGRWQELNEAPYVVCDTGHNEDGIRAVVNQIHRCMYSQLHFVIGVVNDKDLGCILSLLPKEARYYFTKADIPRSLDESVLKNEATKFGLNGNTFATVKEAYDAAMKDATEDDMVFIGGSSFVVGNLLETLS